MLSVRNLRKVYKTKKAESVVALNNVSIDFPEKGFVFLLGKSGSGKSTLLNSIGGLDKFDSGEIIIKGKSSKDFTQSDFDSYRNTFIGFIFQEYNILENFTVAKNLALALELQGKKADKNEVMRLLTQVDMQNYANRKPNQLSGGQKQRVAIARALIKDPEIIMGDEPTGALDSNTGKQVMDTLKELSKKKLVIVVSHDREFAEIYGDRIIELKDGNIISDMTKKEIEAKQTKSGIKVIDNNIVYIKKGQEVTDAEINSISRIILNKAKETDTFISFDEVANKKLKEGAKINDDGNKEKFLDTQQEDIDIKNYNPKDLKLIRSRLKFTDSFKMGASSLKNKFGKLLFTIILSFFAFTVFGIVDALSCWNRVDSVYQAMKLTNQTSLVMVKTKKVTEDGYTSSQTKYATDSDINALKEKYPNYTFKGIIGSSYSSYAITSSNATVKSNSNPFKSSSVFSYACFTKEELQGLGFTVTGRMPTAENEIAISKHILNTLIENTKTDANPITEANVLTNTTKIRIDQYNNIYLTTDPDYYTTIVGIVDDKTDFSKYEKMTDSEVSKNSYLYSQTIQYSYASLAYVCESKFNSLKQNCGESLCIFYGDSTNSYSFSKSQISSSGDIVSTCNHTTGTYYFNETLMASMIVENSYSRRVYYHNYVYTNNYSSYSKRDMTSNESENYNVSVATEFNTLFPDSNSDGVPDGFVEQDSYNGAMFVCQYLSGNSKFLNSDKTLKLGDDEMIISKYQINSLTDDIKEQIENGEYYAYVSDNYSCNQDTALLKLKVVGIVYDSVGYVFSSNAKNEKVDALFGTYSAIMSALNGSASDSELVKTCEVYDSNNIKYTIQNSATTIMDLFEEIINSTAKVFFYIAIGFAVFAAVLLMNFISTSISYKKREIGVLRALGARGKDIFGIFFNESTLIAFINFALAAVATFVGCNIINKLVIDSLGMEIVLLNVGIRQILLILAVSWGSAFLASLIPTTKISKKKPIDAINNR